MKAATQNLLLTLGSVALCLVALEVGYRVHLSMSPFRPLDPPVERFTASATVYGEYDADVGVRYQPGSSHHVVAVSVDGQVPWAPALPISRCNEDGFMGRTRLAEYQAAPIKVVTFGDSYTHWNQEGETWPDLLQTRLRTQLGADVAVLNHGRGGYGVLQMVDLAAKVLPELRPDLAIIAFISDDVTRARWWTRTVEAGGVVRPLLSPSPTDFSLAVAADEYLVNRAITPEWAARAHAAPEQAEPLLGELIAQYLGLKRSFMAARGLRETRRSAWTLTEAFLWNRVTTGLPFADDIVSIPRVTFTDLGDDPRFAANLAALRALGVPLLFVHLPAKHELVAKAPDWARATSVGGAAKVQKLVASLERLAGQPVVLLEGDVAEGVTIPEKIDLLPHNGHPNLAGLALYAELVAKVVAPRLAK